MISSTRIDNLLCRKYNNTTETKIFFHYYSSKALNQNYLIFGLVKTCSL